MGSVTRARVTLARILVLDDEPFILESLQDTLRRHYDVTTAVRAQDALEHLRRTPARFAAVISDMRMPGMSGDTFLSEAQQLAPDTTRILLTGYADVETAISAVNTGQVFRFLTKPCPANELLATCAAAVEQNRLRTAERQLLDETLKGSVKALSDVLALAAPAAFGRSASVRKLVTRLSNAIGLEDSWEVEVAALLVHLGAVTLPAETAEKLYRGSTLTPGENRMVERVPELTRRILENIPRLEGVVAILDSYRRNYRGERSHPEGPAGNEPPPGARVLRLAVDFDALEAHGADPVVVIAAMRSREKTYDPEMLAAFAELMCDPRDLRRVKQIPLLGLRAGMMLADDVRASNGNLLIARGHTATEQLVTRLWNLTASAVREPLLVIDES
jgi:response regulator RpfG family c-di-GMP phosphodiesterase